MVHPRLHPPHTGVRYNCRVFVLNRQILLIRPKMALANDGNYRETRWFASWKHKATLERHPLPRALCEATQQDSCPFGDAVLACEDAVLAAETCEELFTPMVGCVGGCCVGGRCCVVLWGTTCIPTLSSL